MCDNLDSCDEIFTYRRIRSIGVGVVMRRKKR
jgi:hypothetical protein